MPAALTRHAPPSSPGQQVRAIEYLAEVLATSDEEGRGDDFYGLLSEATTRLTSLRRAVIFRYDSARRRVRLAGCFGIDLSEFEGFFVTVESAPIARRSLEEDRVIEVSGNLDEAMSAEWAERFELTNLVCAPMVARGRAIGVIVGDRAADAPAPDERERELLWILGKTAALASMARVATRQHEKALQLEQRIDLARDLHEGVVQRLFGVSLALSGEQPFDEQTRRRCAEEVQGALADLRTAVSRPLGRSVPRTNTTLAAEVERLHHQHPDLGIDVAAGAEIAAPAELEPLAQSVLAEAIRNAHKHASPSEVRVQTETKQGTFVLEVTNDGVKGPLLRKAGMGLRLAALEALQAGGLLEFGMRGEDRWQVRLVVRCEEPS
ncbi:MAG TPA: GAF domain-containing protein [Solirubrobacteraceae bacterium]|nr:GAF domain-containing protein [Solirubrobacteraceae bacterium]